MEINPQYTQLISLLLTAELILSVSLITHKNKPHKETKVLTLSLCISNCTSTKVFFTPSVWTGCTYHPPPPPLVLGSPHPVMINEGGDLHSDALSPSNLQCQKTCTNLEHKLFRVYICKSCHWVMWASIPRIPSAVNLLCSSYGCSLYGFMVSSSDWPQLNICPRDSTRFSEMSSVKAEVSVLNSMDFTLKYRPLKKGAARVREQGLVNSNVQKDKTHLNIVTGWN